MFNTRRAVTIDDLRTLARRRLPEFAFVPIDTGSGDGSGVTRNVAAFKDYLFRAFALTDITRIDQSVTIFGQTYSSPFGISAVGNAGNLRRNADEFLAEAAVEANIPFMLSGVSSASVESIARIAPHHVWQQIYAARDPKLTESLVYRARDAGVSVLVHTVDSPVRPYNNWLTRVGIRLPMSVRAVRPSAWPYVVLQSLTHLAWTMQHLSHGGLPRMESWAPYAPAGSSAAVVAKICHQQISSANSWETVERLRRIWPGKLVLKGLVASADALRALDMGADAVTVSNHGGNKLDCMAAAIDFLPAIASSIGKRAPVLFDGGIRSGAHILTAYALGARMCFVGRATLYGVIAGGREGAGHAINIVREEITRTLALIGCPSVVNMSADFLARDSHGLNAGIDPVRR